MNKSFFLIMSILLVLILVIGCKKAEVSTVSTMPGIENAAIDEECYSGGTVKTVPLKENKLENSYIVGAYTVRPDESCNLPDMFCTYVNTLSGIGGPTCVAIKE